MVTRVGRGSEGRRRWRRSRQRDSNWATSSAERAGVILMQFQISVRLIRFARLVIVGGINSMRPKSKLNAYAIPVGPKRSRLEGCSIACWETG